MRLVRVAVGLMVMALCAAPAVAQTDIDASSVYLWSGGSSRGVLTTGSGAPSAGATGDWYIDYATGDLYTKRSGTWSVIPRLEAANGWTAAQGINTTEPALYLIETDQGTNLKNLRLDLQSGVLQIQSLTDAFSVTSTLWTLNRSTGAMAVLGGITAGSGAVGIVDSTGKLPALSSTYLASLSGANLTALPAGQLTGTITSSVQDNITRTGALASGTIASAFGSIDVGSDSITGGALIGTTGSFSSTLGVTGVATFTAAPVFSSGTASQTMELTSGKALTTVAITGTGNYVKSASPTLTGTISAVNETLSGTLSVSGSSTLASATFSSSAGTSSYVSQTTGWQVSPGGAADFRSVFADEMHARIFTADLDEVTRGNARVTKSYGILSAAFTCPVAAGTTTLTVFDAPDGANMRLFSTNDWVVLQSYSRTDADNDGNLDLTIGDCVGQVTNYVDGTGDQSWTFTRGGTGASAGNMPSTTVVPINNIAIDYGPAGSGFTLQSATDGAEAANAPYFGVTTFVTAPIAANMTSRCRLGNLRGITSTTEYGMLCGNFSGNAYVRFSDQNAEITGIPFILKDGATVTMKLDPAVPSFAMGSTLPSAFGTGAGLWMGKDTSFKFRLGDPAGGQMAWDGTTLKAGGWTIGADYIKDTAGVVGMSSAVTGGDDIRFWAGDSTPSSAEFRVTEAGLLTVTGAVITGANITVGTGAGFTLFNENEAYKLKRQTTTQFGQSLDVNGLYAISNGGTTSLNLSNTIHGTTNLAGTATTNLIARGWDNAGAGSQTTQVSISLQSDASTATITMSGATTINNTLAVNSQTINGPTGGNKGPGTLNVAGDIYKNNVAYVNPKWALQHFFTGTADVAGPYEVPSWYIGLRPLDEHRAFVRSNFDLPLMLQEQGAGLFRRGDLLLASVEEAYLYIYQLHDRLAAIEAEIFRLKAGGKQ